MEWQSKILTVESCNQVAECLNRFKKLNLTRFKFKFLEELEGSPMRARDPKKAYGLRLVACKPSSSFHDVFTPF